MMNCRYQNERAMSERPKLNKELEAAASRSFLS